MPAVGAAAGPGGAVGLQLLRQGLRGRGRRLLQRRLLDGAGPGGLLLLLLQLPLCMRCSCCCCSWGRISRPVSSWPGPVVLPGAEGLPASQGPWPWMLAHPRPGGQGRVQGRSGGGVVRGQV